MAKPTTSIIAPATTVSAPTHLLAPLVRLSRYSAKPPKPPNPTVSPTPARARPEIIIPGFIVIKPTTAKPAPAIISSAPIQRLLPLVRESNWSAIELKPPPLPKERPIPNNAAPARIIGMFKDIQPMTMRRAPPITAIAAAQPLDLPTIELIFFSNSSRSLSASSGSKLAILPFSRPLRSTPPPTSTSAPPPELSLP